MSNNVKIYYNNVDVFQGIAPTPFVSISQDYIDFGNKWNQVTNIILEGQLIASSDNLLNNAVRLLHERFSNNYKTLSIRENNSNLYVGNNAIINSINIEESSWYGSLPFSIDISIYDENYFQDYYGVVEPEENFSFDEENGDILNLVHSVSAKGIVSNNKNAIQNAKEWVSSRSNNFNQISPILIKNANAVKNREFILYSTQEVIDRFNGTYSIEKTYRKSLNLENPDNCFLNYTIDLSYNLEDGLVTANINGNLEGNNLNILQQEYNKLNLHALCNKISKDTYNELLTNRALSQSVEEISEENKLNFGASFNNDDSNEVINDYTIDINEDSLKCIRTASINANISCKYGDLKTKMQKVEQFYRSEFKVKSLVNQEFGKEFSTPLNPEAITESITFDKFNAQITYTAQFTDKKISNNNDIINLSSSVNYTPSVKIHVPKTSAFVPRDHNVQNLECANRSRVEISITAVAKSDKNISTAESVAGSELNRIKLNYLQGSSQLLEEKLVSKNEDLKTVTISETYTFEGSIIS
jgi:viroplasmin and RNaseH domain-containing protein